MLAVPKFILLKDAGYLLFIKKVKRRLKLFELINLSEKQFYNFFVYNNFTKHKPCLITLFI